MPHAYAVVNQVKLAKLYTHWQEMVLHHFSESSLTHLVSQLLAFHLITLPSHWYFTLLYSIISMPDVYTSMLSISAQFVLPDHWAWIDGHHLPPAKAIPVKTLALAPVGFPSSSRMPYGYDKRGRSPGAKSTWILQHCGYSLYSAGVEGLAGHLGCLHLLGRPTDKTMAAGVHHSMAVPIENWTCVDLEYVKYRFYFNFEYWLTHTLSIADINCSYFPSNRCPVTWWYLTRYPSKRQPESLRPLSATRITFDQREGILFRIYFSSVWYLNEILALSA